MARENEVIIFTLVPHTMHEMQPLDTTVFVPLKRSRQEACYDFIQAQPGRVITKYQFNRIFSPAWLKSMVLASIISGFKTCGIHPFNPKAVLDHDPCEPKTSDLKSTDAAQCCSSHSSNLMQYENTVTHNSSHKIADTFTPEEEAKFATRGYD